MSYDKAVLCHSITNDTQFSLKMALRKHPYSNILKISSPKPENFQIKKSDSFHISARNIDCGTH